MRFKGQHCTPSPSELLSSFMPPRCFRHRRFPSSWADRGVDPGGLEEPASWGGLLQADRHRPVRAGGGAERAEEPGSPHQTHNCGSVVQHSHFTFKMRQIRECFITFPSVLGESQSFWSNGVLKPLTMAVKRHIHYVEKNEDKMNTVPQRYSILQRCRLHFVSTFY